MTTAANIEYSVKRFLAEFDLLDQELRSENKVPQVIQKPNFLCLLNIPQITARFGPVRNLWEGSIKGEGYIQHCKQFLGGGQRYNFAINAMKKCLRETAYKRAVDRHEELSDSCEEAVSPWPAYLKSQAGNYIVYKTVEEVTARLRNRKIVSLVQCNDNIPRWFFLTRASHLQGNYPSGLAVYEISMNPTIDMRLVVGGRYYGWKVNEEPWTVPQLAENIPLNTSMEVSFGVLLPLLDRDQGEAKHTMISQTRENP